jgi:putative transposase
MAQRETITRRNLPHWYVPGAMHFVTYRLVGTIPLGMLQQLRTQREARIKQLPPADTTPRQHRLQAHKLFFAAYDRYLDRTATIDWLATPSVAASVRGSLHYHNGIKYHLLAYCVMPNHVHALFQPFDQCLSPEEADVEDQILSDEQVDSLSPLAEIMHSLKSYTAHQANDLLERSGQFWQHESYDHWVRDEEELERVVNYIAWNPVKAGLVEQPHEWFFGSAHDRFLHDGSREGYLCAQTKKTQERS